LKQKQENTMDFTTFLSSLQEATNVFSAWDVALVLTLSFLLALGIGWVYKKTYQGATYTQSYVQTLALMTMVVSVIMLIVGSNIARAFTLLGALSIVRFRNAVKDTRDMGFIFFAMAIGMAVGTRFYFLAIMTTVGIGFLWWLMARLSLFAKDVKDQILKIRLPADVDYQGLFRVTFLRYLSRVDLISVETVQAGTLTELVYDVELKRQAKAQEFLEEVRKLNHNNKVALITGYHSVDL
jgi:uncharacterized membrane protein YhiD involved in acid resistance